MDNVLVLVLWIALLPVVVVSECKNKPILFNFGDSNSDTGGYMAEFGWIIPLPHARLFPHHPSGRLCDGRLTIDFLCENLNTSYLSAYLEPLGSNFEHGANYAVSGSGTQAFTSTPISLDVQVQQFLRFRFRSLELIAQGSKDLIGEEGFTNALYIVDIGQNDLYGALLPNSSFIGHVNTTISKIKSAVQTLYDNGGKYFWVHNTGPFGCLPERLSLNKNQSDIDQYGCLMTLNKAAQVLNSWISDLCDELNTELKNATIVYTDIYSIKLDLIANYSKYGFDSPVMACCGYGGPPYNMDTSIRCGNPKASACPVGSKYISWDGVHYTEAANSLVASKILSTNYSKPSVKFDYFCNA